MNESTQLFISIWIKLFFLLTPFFVMSVFLSLTQDLLCCRTPQGGCMAYRRCNLHLFRPVLPRECHLFRLRNHAGCLSYRSRCAPFSFGCRSCEGEWNLAATGRSESITVVPLAIPITVGPATTGALLVMGTEVASAWERSWDVQLFSVQ